MNLNKWAMRTTRPFLAMMMMVLSVALLLTLPAAASDYTLGIFGNANEDDTINMQDVTYTELIILEYRDRTELADAKYDGDIDILDMTQIALIILGREKEITIVDVHGDAVTVEKPVGAIVVLSDPQADAIRVLEAEDRVVGIGSGLADEDILLPVMSKLPTVGGDGHGQTPDYEAILDLKPDILLPMGTYGEEELEENLNPWVTVVRFDFSTPETMAGEIMKLGYVLDERDRTKEFNDFYLDILNGVKERTEELSEGEKPQVFLCYYPSMPVYRYYAATTGSFVSRLCILAGGNNIAADLSGPMVDEEWILAQNPDIIIAHEGSSLPSGYDTDDITGAKKLIEETMNLPGWEHITAVKDGNVCIEVSDIDHGPQAFITLTYMAKLFHPELFEDLDPEAIHQEYLTRFQRIDYDLNEHGIFFYPPIEINGGLAGIPDRYEGEV